MRGFSVGGGEAHPFGIAAKQAVGRVVEKWVKDEHAGGRGIIIRIGRSRSEASPLGPRCPRAQVTSLCEQYSGAQPNMQNRMATPMDDAQMAYYAAQQAGIAWTPEQLLRLEHEWRQLQRNFAYHPFVRIVPLAGTPPAEYQVEFRTRHGLYPGRRPIGLHDDAVGAMCGCRRAIRTRRRWCVRSRRSFTRT